jgi:cupin 2 domain-containing protein
MDPIIGNLFADVPEASAPEEFLTLLATKAVRIERIVSNGQASPNGFWYNQEKVEWVLLLKGTASLQFDDGEAVELAADDCHLGSRR